MSDINGIEKLNTFIEKSIFFLQIHFITNWSESL